MVQLNLLASPIILPRDLRSYDKIVVNSSAGKDSQALLTLMVEVCRRLGIESRLVVVHCDLGRVEWAGTAELAEEQAKHYGLRFVKVSRPQGDLLDHVRQRKMWPSSEARYCTSDHKRGQVHKVLTQLADEVRAQRGKGYQARILNCMGIRADESPARAQKVPFQEDAMASNGRRRVDTLFPIFRWTTTQVWACIKASGVPYHRAYDLGMPRLSCCFCVLASRDALLLAGHHNRALLDQYVEVEAEIGHTFKKSLPIYTIKQAVEAGEQPSGKIGGWCM
jgi:3'-phosphoadenosine 5'-phosphosulfate sulfotransferase (PAPS reductase)/FAD synthetase